MGFDFGAIVAFVAVAIGFAAVALTAGRFLRPNFPEAAKASIYECGEPTIGTAWMNFNPRFYLVALVFVIFEVDIALTFPVVVVFKEWVAASPRMASSRSSSCSSSRASSSWASSGFGSTETWSG